MGEKKDEKIKEKEKRNEKKEKVISNFDKPFF